MRRLTHAFTSYRVTVLLAMGAILLAYGNHFQNAFHFDDSHTIESNLFIRDLSNVPLFFKDAHTFSSLPVNQSYRPLVTTTLAIDHWLGRGLQPFAFHLDSFLLFLVQCGAMLLLFRQVLDAAAPHERNRWLALFGATLYGLHAAIAETVNYVIARSDILSTLGVVLSVWMFAALPRARRLQLHLVPAVAGILAKEQAAMAAPILFLYVALVEQQCSLRELFRPRNAWRAARPVLPAFAVCAAVLLFAMRMAPGWNPGGVSRLYYAATQPFVMLRYAVEFVLPLHLSADSDWKAVRSLTEPRVLVGAAFVAGAVWLAWIASRSRQGRPIALGILWFFLALAPTSSVIPLAEVTNDHRMYFPFVGLVLAVTAAAAEGLRRWSARMPPWRRWAVVAVPVLVLGAHGVGTHLRNEVWRTEESLWRDVTQKSPDNGRGWMNYGLALMARAEYPGAERCFERALQLTPAYGYAHVNMGILQGALGRAERAERHFRIGLQLAPDVPSLRYFFARWLHQVGRSQEAVPLLREAIAGAPADPAPRLLLLQVLAARGEWADVADVARAVLRVRADDPDARRYLTMANERAQERAPATATAPARTPETLLALSLALYQAGEYQACVDAADEALKLRAGYAEAHNNRCAALNMLKRHREAAAACRRAIDLKPDFQLARNNLAVAEQALAVARKGSDRGRPRATNVSPTPAPR